MNTIRNYLDNMFLTMQETPEVLKAKMELLQMMEDKYQELKAEGKSENEAIGIVIAEFGNIEELIEELNIKEKNEYNIPEEKALSVNMQVFTEYRDCVKKCSLHIAFATMLCINSPSILIFMGGLSEMKNIGLTDSKAGFFGLLALALFIGASIPFFIFASSRLESYDYLKKEKFHLSKAVEAAIRQQKDSFKMKYNMFLTIGVLLCIFSLFPLFFAGSFFENHDMIQIICVCILLFIISLSILFFIPAGMEIGMYNVILQEEDYAKEKKNSSLERISGAYWCIVTAIYLGWSFVTMDWGFTWIIWPVSGVLYGAIAAIFGGEEKKS